jgi:hypothetical protein
MKKKLKFTGLLTILFITAAGMISVEALEVVLDRPLGFVRKYKPAVMIQNAPISKAEKLFSGDTLSTNKNGFALVQFIDKSIAKIKPNSQLIIQGEVEGKNNSSTRINVESGALFLNVTKRSTTNFEVATNSSVASVKGTQFGATEDSYYYVLEGTVELLANSSGETVTLTDRMFGQVNDDGTIDTGELTDEEVEEYTDESDNFEENLRPKIVTLRFRDEEGEIQTLEVEYFEN